MEPVLRTLFAYQWSGAWAGECSAHSRLAGDPGETGRMRMAVPASSSACTHVRDFYLRADHLGYERRAHCRTPTDAATQEERRLTSHCPTSTCATRPPTRLASHGWTSLALGVRIRPGVAEL